MTKQSVDKRLERLLVMVPWVSSQEGPTVEDVCERFAITERELASDLELLFMCGLYPFTPDVLMEADIVDGRVWIRFAEAFTRPPAFTREEAVSLLAAASAVSDMRGSDGDNAALASAMMKLARALGIEDEDVVEVELAKAPVAVLETVQRASVDKRAIEVDYYSYGRDSWKRRVIEPYRVFNAEGQWYVFGLAVEVGETRNFRVDRMRDVTVLDQAFDAPPDGPAPGVYQPRADDPVVVLDFDSEAMWIAEQYPLEDCERLDDGTLRVTMKVSEPLWLERLLLRVGTHATVVKGEVKLGALAERLLRRYENN